MVEYITACQRVGKNEYIEIHRWIKKNYGKASKCVHCKKLGKKRYEWALVKGFNYERKIENYIQLCCSCHRIYDFDERVAEKISKTLTGRRFKGNPVSEERKKVIAEKLSIPVHQLSRSGEFIKQWPSATIASRELKIYGICSVCKGKRNSAGGFKWKYVCL